MRIFKSFLSILVFTPLLLLAKPAHASSNYYVEGKAAGYNIYPTFIVSKSVGTYDNQIFVYYKISFANPCVFGAYGSISGDYFYSSPDTPPVKGDSFSFGGADCSVYESTALNLDTYTIESVSNATTLILSRNGLFYELQTTSDCGITTKDRGQSISIDNAWPYPEKDVLLLGSFPHKVCAEYSLKVLTIQKYSYVRTIDSTSISGHILLKGKSGVNYIVWYGSGCSGSFSASNPIYIENENGGDGELNNLSTDLKLIVYQFESNDNCFVLGVKKFNTTIASLKLKYGSYAYVLNGGAANIYPFKYDYNGAVWARSVDFGSDGKIFIFINSGPYKKGQIRVYKENGDLLKSYNPYGGFATSGLNATMVIESNGKVYLAVGMPKSGTAVKTYQIVPKGLHALNSLTASTKTGNILVSFQKLYKNQYGLVTKKYGDAKSLKVWKLDLKTNKFVEDKKINKAKIKI